MNYEIIKKYSSILLIILGGINAILFILCIGGGGVLNDWDFALEEMQEIERKNLFVNLPEQISSIAKEQIRLGHTSAEINEYINETNKNLKIIENSFLICITLFFLTTIVIIYCRKRL